MTDEIQGEMPPPHAILSIVKLLALVWFMAQPKAERLRALQLLRWVAGVFRGPVSHWPLDMGRPLAQAVPVIRANRSAAIWIERLAEQLQIIDNTPEVRR